MDDCCESDPSILSQHYSFRFHGVNSRDRATCGMSCSPDPAMSARWGGLWVYGQQRNGKKCACRYLHSALPELLGYPIAILHWAVAGQDEKTNRLDRLIPAPAYRSSDLLHESSSASAIGHSLAQETYAEMKGGRNQVVRIQSAGCSPSSAGPLRITSTGTGASLKICSAPLPSNTRPMPRRP